MTNPFDSALLWEADTLAFLRDRVSAVTGVTLSFPIRAEKGPGLTIHRKRGEAQVRAEDKAALARGLFLLAQAVREGRDALNTEQRRHFAHCGAMLDMSRNRVMTVEAVKRWIDRQAALGLNLLMLYTEDTYEIPAYPYFGYLRGRYTQKQLKEIDDYAYSMGVELVPCIQTLAHLKQFLQWPSSYPLRDQDDILLIDSEATYDFIDAALCSLSPCFRSRRIHIGMDEAHGVGLGQYLKRHGYADRFQLMSRHLSRVVELCGKYGFRPMMWSDMFFRLGSVNGEYYDPACHIPQSVIDALPPVEMVYWDYYHTDEADYERMLAQHARLGTTTVFAGGVWAWSGFLPNYRRTLRTMEPALRVCARRQTDTVLATFWGDDGAEADYESAIEGLTLFSEACWQGETFSLSACEKAADLLTGTPAEVRRACDAFHADQCGSYTGKILIWSDPLYPNGVPKEHADALLNAAEAAVPVLEKAPQTLPTRYALLLLQTLCGKIRLIRTLRAGYESGDRDAMRRAMTEEIPDLIAAYKALADAHGELWESECKRQGWEVLSLRYGGAMERLRDVAGEIGRWLDGRLDRIEELDEPVLPDGKGGWYDQVSTPSAKT